MDKNAVTAEEMQLIDKKAIFEFGIPSIVLMENAGRAAYLEARSMLSSLTPKSVKKKVLILCGKGNNGGDGLVVSRYLANDGIDVSVYMLCEEKRLKKDPLINFNILRNMDINMSCIRGEVRDISKHDLIIDAIFGTGFKGNPDEFTSKIINQINQSNVPILSIDVPSGLNATTGSCQGACIKATRTISFGLPKTGFYKENGPSCTGEAIIENIGLPLSRIKI